MKENTNAADTLEAKLSVKSLKEAKKDILKVIIKHQLSIYDAKKVLLSCEEMLGYSPLAFTEEEIDKWAISG